MPLAIHGHTRRTRVRITRTTLRASSRSSMGVAISSGTTSIGRSASISAPRSCSGRSHRDGAGVVGHLLAGRVVVAIDRRWSPRPGAAAVISTSLPSSPLPSSNDLGGGGRERCRNVVIVGGAVAKWTDCRGIVPLRPAQRALISAHEPWSARRRSDPPRQRPAVRGIPVQATVKHPIPPRCAVGAPLRRNDCRSSRATGARSGPRAPDRRTPGASSSAGPNRTLDGTSHWAGRCRPAAAPLEEPPHRGAAGRRRALHRRPYS